MRDPAAAERAFSSINDQSANRFGSLLLVDPMMESLICNTSDTSEELSSSEMNDTHNDINTLIYTVQCIVVFNSSLMCDAPNTQVAATSALNNNSTQHPKRSYYLCLHRWCAHWTSYCRQVSQLYSSLSSCQEREAPRDRLSLWRRYRPS